MIANNLNFLFEFSYFQMLIVSFAFVFSCIWLIIIQSKFQNSRLRPYKRRLVFLLLLRNGVSFAREANVAVLLLHNIDNFDCGLRGRESQVQQRNALRHFRHAQRSHHLLLLGQRTQQRTLYPIQIFMDKSYKSYGHYADLGIELIDQQYNHKIQKKLEYTSQFLIYHQIDQNEYLQYLSTSRKFFVFYFF